MWFDWISFPRRSLLTDARNTTVDHSLLGWIFFFWLAKSSSASIVSFLSIRQWKTWIGKINKTKRRWDRSNCLHKSTRSTHMVIWIQKKDTHMSNEREKRLQFFSSFIHFDYVFFKGCQALFVPDEKNNRSLSYMIKGFVFFIFVFFFA